METVYSPNNAYLIIREMGRSPKCRWLVGRDNEGGLYALNQLKDRRLIAKHLNIFDETIPDFAECFVFDGDYFSVFKYHGGTEFGSLHASGLSPAELLGLCGAVCLSVLTDDLPAVFLCQIISPDCIVVKDGEIKVNKFFTFLDEDYGPQYAAQKLAAFLADYITEAELDPFQAKTLDGFIQRLEQPFENLLKLYLYVRDFTKSYTPIDTKDIIEQRRQKAMETAGKVRDMAMFYASVASAVMASLLLLWGAFRKPNEQDMRIRQVGGYVLNERGGIDESYSKKTQEKNNN